MRILFLDNNRFHFRCIERGRDNIICQSIVDDAPAIPDKIFEQPITDSLKCSSLNLALDKQRMNRAAYVLSRSDPDNFDFKSVWIDLDFGDICAPRISRVGVAREFIFIPIDSWRVGIIRKSMQLAVVRKIFAPDFREAGKHYPIRNVPAIDRLDSRFTVPFGNKMKQLFLYLASC